MLKRSPSPTFIKPAMPQLVTEPPSGVGWLHEIKHDGYRTQLAISGGQARAFTRRGHDWSREYAPVVAATAALPCNSALIDGEMVVQDEHGVSDFAALRSAITWVPERLVYFAFDLLHLDGEDLRGRPLEERRDRLRYLVPEEPKSCIAFSDGYTGDGGDIFREAEAAGLEGIVSKRLGSRYRSGGQSGWLKTKAFVTGTFDVIGVDRTPTGAPVALLAAPGTDGPRYVGNAFVSLPADLREAFWRYVDANKAEDSPVKGMRRKGATWVRPELRAEVRHLRGERSLRHATLQGLQVLT